VNWKNCTHGLTKIARSRSTLASNPILRRAVSTGPFIAHWTTKITVGSSRFSTAFRHYGLLEGILVASAGNPQPGGRKVLVTKGEPAAPLPAIQETRRARGSGNLVCPYHVELSRPCDQTCGRIPMVLDWRPQYLRFTYLLTFRGRLNRPRKECHLGWKGVPKRLRPDSLQSIYVRPDARCGEVGRTLQKHEFFRKLLRRGTPHQVL
jgi:hypothetical protein